MQKKQIVINAITSVTQILVVGVSLFFLYKYLLRTIGVEQLGIWSVVLATSSAASFAKKGLSGSAVKYVATYLAKAEEETVSRVIQTSVITIGIFSGVALILTYPLMKWILKLVIPTVKIEMAYAILPYALVSFWLITVASVYYAGLDGYQRTDLRSWVLMAGALFLLTLAYLVVPAHGLMGLAYAQVAQGLFILLMSWALLKRRLRILPFIPRKWDRSLFKEMIGYGLNLQAMNILQIFYDPITKALLTKFGDLSMTGYYEMATRMVVQLRTLIVAANQVMVPTIADLHEKGSELLQKIYKDSYRLILYISVPFFSGIAILTPAISYLWIGFYEPTFVVFTYILALGWFLNTLISPSYFSNLGTGELKWNTLGHLVIGILNVVLCFLFGSLFGGTAVVIASAAALALGSAIIPIAYHRRHGLSLSILFPREIAPVAGASLAGTALVLGGYYLAGGLVAPARWAAASVGFFAAMVALPMWKSPVRGQITAFIGSVMPYGRTKGEQENMV